MPRKKRRRTFGRVFKDGNRRGWYVSFHHHGRRVKRAAGPSRADAEKKLLQVEALIRSGVPLPAVLSAVFDDFGHLTCLGVREAVQEFFDERPESVIEIVAGQAVVFKGQAAAWKAAA